MTTYYVDSATGSNANTGLSSAAPKQYLILSSGGDSVTSAYTLTSADTIYIKTGHVEHLATSDVTVSLGSANIVGVNSLTSPSAFASKSDIYIGHASAAASARDFTVNNIGLLRGITLAAGESLKIGSATNAVARIYDCDLKQLSAAEKCSIQTTAQDGVLLLTNVDIGVNATEVTIGGSSGSVRWIGGRVYAVSGTPPGLGFGSETGDIAIDCVDLSACSSAINSTGSENGSIVRFTRCKLPSTLGPSSFSATKAPRFEFMNCSTADNYFEQYLTCYEGAVSLSVAKYLSATYDGSTGYSVKFAASSNASQVSPLYWMLAEIPSVDLTSGATVTVELLQVGSGSSPSALKDSECWILVEGTDSTDLALGKIYKSTEAMLFQSPADLTTSTETWSVTTDVTKQKISVSVGAATGADDVPLRVFLFLAKASAVVYVDPDVVVT